MMVVFPSPRVYAKFLFEPDVVRSPRSLDRNPPSEQIPPSQWRQYRRVSANWQLAEAGAMAERSEYLAVDQIHSAKQKMTDSWDYKNVLMVWRPGAEEGEQLDAERFLPLFNELGSEGWEAPRRVPRVSRRSCPELTGITT